MVSRHMLASHHLVSILLHFALRLFLCFLPLTGKVPFSRKLFMVERSLDVLYLYGVIMVCMWAYQRRIVTRTGGMPELLGHRHVMLVRYDMDVSIRKY